MAAQVETDVYEKKKCRSMYVTFAAIVASVGGVLFGYDIEVPIDNVNTIIQRHTKKDSSDDDECNINESISDKEQLSIKSYGSFLDTVPELEKFAMSQGDAEILELLKNTRILAERRIIHKKICT
ncbi:hypothetical protein AVEN_57743-3 [Araneus ventricosus]|uniref:Uncharacterized protein n=1 Tax=Araneus ventricosus TaxID=182803 RepID=A0A4Y2WSP0_ARAVE|nr:hypothetical protein AVEN_57743-2 [Araneus ventricosus]GBO40423.1 hypothetical protein AVEN_57743-1 [Araneus ventricosus]GBO40424.1 hypothetical protein AVEN_57743-3 [Araneus ventricosus]